MAKTDLIVEAHEGLTLGASEIAAAAGLDPWRTPLDLYLDKLKGRLDRSSEAMEWGLRNEPHILQLHARLVGQSVLGMDLDEEPCLYRPDARPVWSSQKTFKRWVSDDVVGLVTDTCEHPKHTALTCHPDGFEIPDTRSVGGVVQAKNMSAYATLEDYLPEHYQLQAHHELFVLRDLTGWDLDHTTVIFQGGSSWHEFSTEHNEEVGELIAGIAHAFIQRVIKGVPPEPTLDKRGQEALARLFGGLEGKMEVGHGDEAHGLLCQLRTVKEDLKQLQSMEDELKVEIQSIMKEHTKIEGPDVKATWSKQTRRTTVDYDAVVERLAELAKVEDSFVKELIDEHSKEGRPYRIFRTYF